MPDGQFQYVLLGALAIALLIAAFTDIRSRRIANWLTLSIALAAPLFWWASGLTLWPGVAWQVGVAAITFAVCAALFAGGQMGGGDVKLLTALALWIMPMPFLRLLMLMALIGGGLTVVIWAWHVARRHPHKPAIPYGIAIASAGLWVLSAEYLPSFEAAMRGPAAG